MLRLPFLEFSLLPLGSILRFLILVPFFEAVGFPQGYLGCPLYLWMKTRRMCTVDTSVHAEPFPPQTLLPEQEDRVPGQGDSTDRFNFRKHGQEADAWSLRPAQSPT